jgi:hypothetical protein
LIIPLQHDSLLKVMYSQAATVVSFHHSSLLRCHADG